MRCRAYSRQAGLHLLHPPPTAIFRVAQVNKPASVIAQHGTTFSVLFAISFCHMLNDMMQSLIPSIYPSLKTMFHLSFAQVGLITLVFQCTASLLQPVVGFVSDKRPMPFSLPVGAAFTLVGIAGLGMAQSYGMVLLAAAIVGVGSSVFHPESARVARMASGGRHGLAQSLFQVGGNTGSALGPILAAAVVMTYGHKSITWSALFALISIVVLFYVGRWYKDHGIARMKAAQKTWAEPGLSQRRIVFSIFILLMLIFSKYFYLASITSYYTFYLIHHFHVSVQAAQIHLFVFLGAVAVGTFAGGPIGDRIGRKLVIWVSILGILPFTLMLPFANLFWTSALSVIIGLLLASAFPAIVVFAQELMPGRIGMVSGMFYGFSFGMGGIGAAMIGLFADRWGIEYTYSVCSFLPAIGLLTALLPNIEKGGKAIAASPPVDENSLT
ncbi:MAG: MFS transporter [Proteobacteria bacterium]|nr:MFS transporter [Pseudomonadota bacterium]